MVNCRIVRRPLYKRNEEEQKIMKEKQEKTKASRKRKKSRGSRWYVLKAHNEKRLNGTEEKRGDLGNI